MPRRLAEAGRLGFRTAYVPPRRARLGAAPDACGHEVTDVRRHLATAVRAALQRLCTVRLPRRPTGDAGGHQRGMTNVAIFARTTTCCGRPSPPWRRAPSCATVWSASCAAARGRSSCSARQGRRAALARGGFPLDVEFSATRLRELAKMDGAHRARPRGVARILRAATQLVPDPSDRDVRVRHPAPHGRARGQADRLSPSSRSASRCGSSRSTSAVGGTSSRTPAPSCPAPTRPCRPSSATSRASTRSPAPCRPSRSRTSSPSATSPACSSASRWSAGSARRSRATSSSSATTAACSPSSSRSWPAGSATTASSSSATTSPAPRPA